VYQLEKHVKGCVDVCSALKLDLAEPVGDKKVLLIEMKRKFLKLFLCGMNYGTCIVCGRKIKNRIFHKGTLIYICPGHVKGMKKDELSKFLDDLLKVDKRSSEQYKELMKMLSILDSKISTLSDKISLLIKVVTQRKLDEYKVDRDTLKTLETLSNIIKKLSENQHSISIKQDSDDLTVLNQLTKKCSKLHYKIEDGIIDIWLESGVDNKTFREIDKTLRRKGYVYDRKTYKWVKTLS